MTKIACRQLNRHYLIEANMEALIGVRPDSVSVSHKDHPRRVSVWAQISYL